MENVWVADKVYYGRCANSKYSRRLYQNSETAVMLVFQNHPLGVEPFSQVTTFFCCDKFA